jgi:hypothetical protein
MRPLITLLVCAISAAACAQTTRPKHTSNFDESKVGHNTLPDPLLLSSGQPVRDAKTWFNVRRPEIVRYFENDIYGRVPASAPEVSFEVASIDRNYLNGAAIHKQIIAHIGGPAGVAANLSLVIPAGLAHPPPVLLAIDFGADYGPGGAIADESLFQHGYARIHLSNSEIQSDAKNHSHTGVQGLALALGGQKELNPNDWGTIACWAWGASRVMDYLETDREVDAKHVAIFGFSRCAKAALYAGAIDQRFSLMFACCPGKLGGALSRRDYGETIDDLATNYPWQFAGNLQKYVGHWNDLPVDAHSLIALCAPRPVLLTGGVEDQWNDPRGEFLAERAAGSVYRLLGAKDIGTSEMPKPDAPVLTGDLAFHYHHEGHMVTASDWAAFFEFADRYLKTAKP